MQHGHTFELNISYRLVNTGKLRKQKKRRSLHRESLQKRRIVHGERGNWHFCGKRKKKYQTFNYMNVECHNELLSRLSYCFKMI